MNPMNTAPRDGREVLLVRSGTGRQQFERRKWCAEHALWEWDMGGGPEGDFSGWLDIDAMIDDRARLVDLLRRALVHVPTFQRVTPEGCDESMVQPNPLFAEIKQELGL